MHTRRMSIAARTVHAFWAWAILWPALAAARVEWRPEERDYLAAKGTLHFCVDPDWAPLERIDEQGRHVGMAADFLTLMADHGQLQLRLVPTKDWNDSMARARSGECDLLSLANATPEREVFLDFTTPYLELPIVVVTRADVPHIANIVQVADRPLGILRGFAAGELFRLKFPGIRLVPIDSYAQGFGMVQSGELFGVLGNMASVGQMLQKNKVLDLKIAGWTGEQAQLGIATRKDEPLLQGIFQKLVDAIEPRETQTIMNRWLAVRFEQGFDYRLFWRTFAIVLAAGAIVVTWAMTLRRLNRQLSEANGRLAEVSRRDALTGLHNRMHLDQELPSLIALCRRNRLPLSLAVIDIDFFKQVNDRHGHPFGDAALCDVARRLEASFRRSGDMVVRYGGEEFIVVVAGGSADDARARMQAFREDLRQRPVAVDGIEASISASIGLLTTVPGAEDTPAQIIARADAALYAAKRDGRDRVVCAAEDAAPHSREA